MVLDFRPTADQKTELLLGRRVASTLHALLRDYLAEVAGHDATVEQRQRIARQIEVVRVRCVPPDDYTAREIGLTMAADLVLWGEASCPFPAPGGGPQFEFNTTVEQKPAAETGGLVVIKGPVTTQVQLPRLKELRELGQGSYCVRAALTTRDLPALRSSAESSPASAVQTDLSLPRIVGGNANDLIVFVAGVHFYRQSEYSRALHFFRNVSTRLRSDKITAAGLLWMMGDAEMRGGRPGVAAMYFQGGAAQARAKSKIWWKHRLSLLDALVRAGRTSEARALVSRLGRKSADPDVDAETRGFVANRLSGSLSDLGRREEALEVARTAVALRRRLTADWPERFAVDLAASLNDLSVLLGDLGRREEALGAVRDALAVYDRMASGRSDAFEAGRATSLSNLSVHLNALGRPEEALEAVKESVEIRRRLARARPEAFEPDLAASLNNLSVHLSELGKRGEALEAAVAAVELCQRLGSASPEVFRPDLAMSLSNLSTQQAALGKREEALESAEGGVELYRQLVKVRPKAFEAKLAMSLNNLSLRLGILGRREEALEAILDAVEVYERLAKARPEAFEAELAMSLNNLSVRLGGVGRRREALEAVQRAVEIRRRLAKERPEAFEAELAASLNNLSVRLGSLERRKEALEAIQGAVEVLERLAEARPEAFEANLARSLSHLAVRAREMGRLEQALGAARRAVEIRRRLEKSMPAVFRADLAASLEILALLWIDLGRQDRADSVGRELAALSGQPWAVRFKPVACLRLPSSRCDPDRSDVHDISELPHNLQVGRSQSNW